MRLLIYGINYWPELTGVGKFTGEMAEWLSGRGHDVRVITSPPYYPEWKIGKGYSAWKFRKQRTNGVEVQRCPVWIPKKVTVVSRLIHLLSFAFSSAPPVLWNSLRWRPDRVLVIQPSLFCAPAALAAAWVGGAQSWLHIQDSEVDALFELGAVRRSWLKTFLLFCEHQVLKRFDRISTISGKMQELIVGKGIPAERQILFCNWVDTAHIFPASTPSGLREELGFRTDDIIVLYSGNMGNKQGLEIILTAASRLKSQPGIRLVLSGEGSMRLPLMKLAEGLDNVRFLPLQPFEKLNDLLNLADIHVLVQRPEVSNFCLPSKLTGMLASGRPVIATAFAGSEIAKIVGVCGIVVEPGDAAGLAEAIFSLSIHPDKRRFYGAAARQYALSLWDKSNVLNHFERQIGLTPAAAAHR